jgi:hypothetical protein
MREFIPRNNLMQNYQSDIQRISFSPPPPAQNKNSREGFFFERILKKIFGGIWKLWKKFPKILKWIIVILILGAIGTWITLKIIHNNQQKNAQVYEALVMPVDQKNPNAVEDAKSSLKYGDVIAIFPEGHSWSDTEKNSYLIVKIKLTKDEAAELTQSKTQKSKNQSQTPVLNNDNDKTKTPKQPQQPEVMETVLARQYRLKIPNFDTQKFWGGGGQPFGDKVFDDSIIQKK